MYVEIIICTKKQDRMQIFMNVCEEGGFWD